MKNIDRMKKQIIDAYTEAVSQMTEEELLTHICWCDEQNAALFPKVWSCDICKKAFGECEPMKKDLDLNASEEFCNKRYHNFCQMETGEEIQVSKN